MAHWANAGRSRKTRDGAVRDEAAEAFRRVGVPEEEIYKESGDAVDDKKEAFKVWRGNVRALNCFLIVASRRLWRVGPMGGIIGLDYDQVETMLGMRKIEVDDELLDDLAVMEDAAVEVLNAK